MQKPKKPFNPSRRSIMKQALVAAGVIATGTIFTTPLVKAAAKKASKAEMMYMDKPHGKDQCDGCIHYVPGPKPTANGTCKIVQGSISPRGWCVAFTPKK